MYPNTPSLGGAWGGYKVCHDVSLQMVDVNKGYAQRAGEALGKVDAHEQRAHQSRSSGKGHCRQLFFLDACPPDGFVYHGHDVLLMGTASQFGHHAAVGLMHGLRRGHVRQQLRIPQHCRRRIVATRLYT